MPSKSEKTQQRIVDAANQLFYRKGYNRTSFTDVVEEAQGLELARLLADEGVPVTVYDPAAMENAKGALGDSVTFASSLEACIAGADAIVITTPWEEFKRIEPSWLAGNPRRPVLVDCWRILEPARYREVADYSALGVGPQSG